jgi:hypothetical protein
VVERVRWDVESAYGRRGLLNHLRIEVADGRRGVGDDGWADFGGGGESERMSLPVVDDLCRRCPMSLGL